MSKDKPPEGWTRTSLAEVVPEEILDPLVDLLNKIRSGDIAGRAAHDALVDLLSPHRDHIEKNGVVVEYLAYWLEHAVHRKML